MDQFPHRIVMRKDIVKQENSIQTKSNAKLSHTTVYRSEFFNKVMKNDKLIGNDYKNSNLLPKKLPIAINMPIFSQTQTMATFRPYIIH